MSAEAKERLASEQAAARERAAQRQQMAVEELIHTERTYLKHLQLCTVTIRNNLQKIEVHTHSHRCSPHQENLLNLNLC